jgi:membrane protein DedA with SNARE-associated domain
MIHDIHFLIAKYGLVAVFAGCVAEGESAAILAGFFAHQHVFVAWQAFAAASVGAFTGDVLFFLLGRRFADHGFVRQLRVKPGFDRAHAMIEAHPDLFVLTNRYIYGFRLVGGIAAGLSSIALARFLALNALSSLIWALLFTTLGYVFGLGAEQVIGKELQHHERLLIALLLGVAVVAIAAIVAHRRGSKTP